MPSRASIQRVIKGANFSELERIFYKWTRNHVPIKEREWISIDGKAIRGTVRNHEGAKQNFTSLVSMFVSKRKQVLSVKKIENKKESEIPAVKQLIEMLDLEGVIFTLDALHCQKETVKTIVENKNDYVIGVKGNQKKLLQKIKKNLSGKKR